MKDSYVEPVAYVPLPNREYVEGVTGDQLAQIPDDPVNHPSHYTQGKIEVIDFIEDKKLPFHLANVVKYVARAGHKDPTKEVEDLEKARWYLDRYITLKKEENKNG